MKKVTKQQVADWVGGDNLSCDKLLEILTELANGEYFAEQFKSDVLIYAEDF